MEQLFAQGMFLVRYLLLIQVSAHAASGTVNLSHS